MHFGCKIEFFVFFSFQFRANNENKITSGSELLLNSTGSFKRFDSIDRDYKADDQTSLTLNVSTAENIPPQPLRLAPAPLSPLNLNHSPEKTTKQRR